MNHPAALARLDELLEHPILCEFRELLAKIAAYETEQHPIPLPTLAQAMRFRREQMGETVAEIARRAGVAPHIWAGAEAGWRELDIFNARKLHAIGIPADVILQEP